MKSLMIMLSPDEINKIHDATLEVLEKTGVDIEAPDVAEHIKQKGGIVTGSNVRFPKEMVKEAIGLINKTVDFAALDESKSIVLPKSVYTYNSTAGYSPFIYDEPKGDRRPSTAKDLEKIARLCDELDEVDFFWPIVIPSEEAITEMEEISAFSTSLSNIGKHIECSVSTHGGAKYQIEMAQLAAGGKENLRKAPFFSVVASPTTPLSFEYGISKALELMSKAGVPVTPMNVPLSGTTAPGTFAGTLVVTNAEQLAALVILKSYNEDAPMVYSADTGSADMNTGDVSYDNPDYDLYSIACGQMAKFYEIPCCVAHGSSEVREFDRASGLERNVMRVALSQMTYTDTSCWIGSKDSCLSTSLWDIVLDAEVARLAKTYSREFAVNDNTLGVDVIKEVGPRGEFLSHKHTYKNFKNEINTNVIEDSYLFENQSNFIENALRKAEKILNKPPKQYISVECKTEIEKVMASARKEFDS